MFFWGRASRLKHIQHKLFERPKRERGSAWYLAARRVGWRMGIMTERRTARRYDLSLPVIIRVPTERVAEMQKGKTRDISTRGVYFVLDQDLEAGSELDITLTLPAEITQGSEVFVRALGKVVRVEIGRAHV